MTKHHQYELDEANATLRFNAKDIGKKQFIQLMYSFFGGWLLMLLLGVLGVSMGFWTAFVVLYLFRYVYIYATTSPEVVIQLLERLDHRRKEYVDSELRKKHVT